MSIQWKLIREVSEKTCFPSTTPEDFNADTCELSWNPLDQLWCPLRIVEVTRLASAHCRTVYLINEGGETASFLPYNRLTAAAYNSPELYLTIATEH